MQTLARIINNVHIQKLNKADDKSFIYLFIYQSNCKLQVYLCMDKQNALPFYLNVQR